MFDETVQNLVRAKMAHAKADASVRQLEDDVATLSVPSLPEAAHAPSVAGERGEDDGGSVTNMARSALSGIALYFSTPSRNP